MKDTVVYVIVTYDTIGTIFYYCGYAESNGRPALSTNFWDAAMYLIKDPAYTTCKELQFYDFKVEEHIATTQEQS